jgi:hypothetical protein
MNSSPPPSYHSSNANTRATRISTHDTQATDWSRAATPDQDTDLEEPEPMATASVFRYFMHNFCFATIYFLPAIVLHEVTADMKPGEPGTLVLDTKRIADIPILVIFLWILDGLLWMAAVQAGQLASLVEKGWRKGREGGVPSPL